jgi:hypothetical protein
MNFENGLDASPNIRISVPSAIMMIPVRMFFTINKRIKPIVIMIPACRVIVKT